MHVVSAGRRTDIPAFHSSWFMERVRAGSVEVKNPFRNTMYGVSLKPSDVIAFVFWTKNGAPILSHLDELTDMGHCWSFHYTVNNYPEFLEPNVPSLSHTLKAIETLAARNSGPVLRWRYDPIVLTAEMTRNRHIANFGMLCELMSPFVTECIFSFCDYYKKTTRNMTERVPDHIRPDTVFQQDMAREMALIARERGIALKSCSHNELVGAHIAKARCIDPEIIARITTDPERLRALAGLKKAPSRSQCGCYASRDIGAYDTCAHGCVYCYANTNPDRAARNLVRMYETDENSPSNPRPASETVDNQTPKRIVR